MQQYWDVKNTHPDKILFFRMGDFYELFYDDAITVAPILGIALTSRNKNSGDETPMCGMPHHSATGYINKLLSNNFKVAICDQIEDPKMAKGLVKRAVTRILSPGMVLDPDTLEQKNTNYICAYDQKAVGFLEPTTGELFYYKFSSDKERLKLIDLIYPVELVLSKQQKSDYLENKKDLEGPHLTEFDDFKNAKGPECVDRLVAYAQYMQGPEILKTILPVEERKLVKRLELSKNVIRHLELFETYKGESKGSFFNSIDRTKTSAGARKLKNWILFPLTDLDAIRARQNQVEVWLQKPNDLKDIRNVFGQMGDIERRLGKISNPNCNARDLVSLANSLQCGLDVSQLCDINNTENLNSILDLITKTKKTIVDEPPATVRDGYLIRSGVSPELDELIELTTDAQSKLLALENREKEQTGISSLKVRYNNVFGYYIEITKTHLTKAPAHYMRKQTLANAERFITPELQELESKILSAKTKRNELEFEIFDQLKKETLNQAAVLLKQSQIWSEWDVLTSFAWLALEKNYSKPIFNEIGELDLKASRHPVIEQMVDRFVSNDIYLRPQGCMLLTGPNMAGKSTIMRQVALTVILGQIGSFVPAREATLPIYDRVFTRIGASDHLSEGLSTFMVEMTEAAEILNEATEKSLVVLDEIGRGTSTYDGMSLAQAILEYLAAHVKCMTFFATHYHELTELDLKYSQIQNHHMKIVERNGAIDFIHTLASGPANKSYGIEVAKRAGLPPMVLKNAQKILSDKEYSPQQFSLDLKQPDTSNVQYEELLSELKNTSIGEMTPLEALNRIAKWQERLN